MSLTPQEQLGQILRAMILSQMERHLPEVELQCGESRGPFVIKELGAEASEGENQITLLDQLGQAHHFEVESRDPLLRRIKGVADARMANCVVTHSEDKIQLVVTKDIRREEDLLAAFLPQHLPSTAGDDSEKKFPCFLCNNAKFSSRERLLAHQSLYCSKSAVASTSIVHPTASPVAILQPTTLPTAPSVIAAPTAVPSIPNVLLLPLAFHDQNDIVQLLGPPQTVLPVAVGRSAMSMMQCPLLIQRSLCSAVTMPASLSYSIGNTSVTIPIASIDTPTTSVAQKRPIGPSPPLDLSKRARLETSPPATLPKAGSSSEIEKPFVCSCGVAFSAETTLKAHQQYYCKDVERSEEPREPQRKIPSRCSQCQFEPQSQSQLSVHIRSCHNDIQAYVCKVCGYRGFSLRGIRSHMRSHPNLDYLKFDTLLATHVAQVKAEEIDDLVSENVGGDTESGLPGGDARGHQGGAAPDLWARARLFNMTSRLQGDDDKVGQTVQEAGHLSTGDGRRQKEQKEEDPRRPFGWRREEAERGNAKQKVENMDLGMVHSCLGALPDLEPEYVSTSQGHVAKLDQQITDLTESVAEITSEKTAGKMEAASESKVAELKKANAALEEENRRLKQQLADTVDYSILEPKREKKKEANAQDSEKTETTPAGMASATFDLRKGLEAVKNVVEKHTIIGDLNAEQAAFKKQLEEARIKEAAAPWIGVSDETLAKKKILDLPLAEEEEDKTQDSTSNRGERVGSVIYPGLIYPDHGSPKIGHSKSSADKKTSLCRIRSRTYLPYSGKATGRVPPIIILLVLEVALGLAVFILFGTQYYSAIFFLIQHVWFWFIALFVTIGAHALLFWAVYSKKQVLFYPLMIYETLYILLMVGCAVWMILDLSRPRNSWIYRYCLTQRQSHDYDNYCAVHTQTLAGINLAVFIVSAILNLFVLDVFYRFRIYLDAGNRRPAVNVVSNEIVPPTTRRPTYDDPTHNIIYSAGNQFQPQPLYIPPPVTTDTSRPYPTVRGPTSPVYPSAPTPLQHLYDAPPAYSQALSDQKY